jgi:hypothetical protein
VSEATARIGTCPTFAEGQPRSIADLPRSMLILKWRTDRGGQCQSWVESRKLHGYEPLRRYKWVRRSDSITSPDAIWAGSPAQRRATYLCLTNSPCGPSWSAFGISRRRLTFTTFGRNLSKRNTATRVSICDPNRQRLEVKVTQLGPLRTRFETRIFE